MSIIAGKPIVVGGKHPITNIENGIVEIFDQDTFQWIKGPTLVPPRRSHTTVVLDETSLVVIGGFSDPSYLTSVETLDLTTQTWHALDNFPKAIFVPVCGLMDSQYLLCIGGGQNYESFNSAFGLNLSSSNPLWQRRALYETEKPVAMGFMVQLNGFLYCMSTYGENFEKARTLRRINLSKPESKWELITSNRDDSFHSMAPYFIKGYTIEPKSSQNL